MRHLLPFTALALALAGCASAPSSEHAVDPGFRAHANLLAKSGSTVSGVLTLSRTGDGVHVRGQVTGLAPNGDFGFHIHEKGDCSAADAASAGGHFNPTGQPHGNAQAGAHHLGDQMNLRSDAAGVARVDAHFAGVSLGTGLPNDVEGKAIVIHGSPDDYNSQPAGNAGKRIGCGVIAR